MTDPDQGRRDDTFDKFFRPAVDDEITDPGVPSGAYAQQPTQQAPSAPGAQYFQQPEQGAGYVPEPQYEPEPEREGSVLVPLMILGVSLAVLAVVGYMFLNGRQDTGTPSNAATSSTSSGAGSTSSTQEGSSSTSSSTSSTTSSTTSSSSTPVTLPAGSDTGCGNEIFSTSPDVSCEFAGSVAAQARAVQAGSSQQIGARSAVTGKQYVFDCNHPDGSFITCVGTAQPDDGRRPTVYVLPN